MHQSVKKTIAQFEEREIWVQLDQDGNRIGEPQEVDVLIKQVARNDFMITYISYLVSLMEKLGNKKMKIVKYILENMDKSTNKLTETIREIAQHCEVSTRSVNETLKILEEAGFIARKTGVVMLSPKIAHRGDARKERYLMTKFRELKEK